MKWWEPFFVIVKYSSLMLILDVQGAALLQRIMDSGRNNGTLELNKVSNYCTFWKNWRTFAVRKSAPGHGGSGLQAVALLCLILTRSCIKYGFCSSFAALRRA